MTLQGSRVWLRPWLARDRDPFAALNADDQVMRHFPEPLTRAASDALADRIETHLAEHGFGLWALEIPGVLEFAGFVGLSHVRFESRFTPAVEIGWRLARAAWGQGYASEAAGLALDHGFDTVGLARIVSFTVPANLRSQAVMRRIGLMPSGGFDHPLLPPDHPMRPHLLYALDHGDWLHRRDG